ncbi:hypothetical protein KEM56_005557 [Ascosphaera pollenicola]|nr:hypothetical protein KEM56_005557 [Ascosphaera pollenicola]
MFFDLVFPVGCCGDTFGRSLEVAFKNIDDLDREIKRLESQVEAGNMKLVDEKKALAEISSLRKQRKGFSGFDDAQKGIDDLKNQIATLKKTLDNPEARALSDRYAEIQKELDAIRAEQNAVFKNLNSLRDERTKIHAEQQAAFQAVRAIKDEHYQARKAYKAYRAEASRIYRERIQAEREARDREHRKQVADRKLEEASQPAFTDEIITAEGLVRFFDPSFDMSTLGLGQKKVETGALRAGVGRTVDDSGMKGMKVLKKDEDDYFAGSAGKSKKGKKSKHNNAAAAPSTFNLSVGVIEELSRVKVDPPMSQDDVPAVVEKLVEKIKDWKSKQATQTEANIAKAKAEIEKLEKESVATEDKEGTTDIAKKPAQKNNAVDDTAGVSAEVELKQEEDAAKDVTEEMKKASIEESQ